MLELFVTFIYQPFLNILVGIYWFMGVVSPSAPDMGVAVILFTIFIRVLLLPLHMSADRSEEDRIALQESSRALDKVHSNNPLLLRRELKKLMRKNKAIVFAEILDLSIQIIIALMLWRIFAKGLPGADLHLIYPWMPKVETPFNLMFLGKFDLSHSNLLLNFLQSFAIFIAETIAVLTSPIKVLRGEIVKYQLTLPVISFFIFLALPAGKKLFIITSLSFSIGYQLVKIGLRLYKRIFAPPAVVVPQGAGLGGDSVPHSVGAIGDASQTESANHSSGTTTGTKSTQPVSSDHTHH